MIRPLTLLTDEDFQGGVIRGLLRLKPDLDIVRVRDVGLGGANDPTILAWAAENGRRGAPSRLDARHRSRAGRGFDESK